MKGIKIFILMAAFVVIKAFLSFRGIRIALVNPRLPAHQEAARGFYELRDAIFSEKYGWEEPKGFERDQYDQASIFLTTTCHGKIVAGCRVIHRDRLSDGHTLPVETYLDEESERIITKKAVEVSRMINTLGNDRLVFLAMHLAVYAYLWKHGFPVAVATIRENYLEKILRKKFGDGYFRKLSGVAMVKKTPTGSVIFVPTQLILD
jgi:N-acyl-L-homoserine lactone synthetase